MRASGSSEGPRPLSPTFFIRFTPRSSSSRRFLLFLLPLWRLISGEAVTFFFGFSLHGVFFFQQPPTLGHVLIGLCGVFTFLFLLILPTTADTRFTRTILCSVPPAIYYLSLKNRKYIPIMSS